MNTPPTSFVLPPSSSLIEDSVELLRQMVAVPSLTFEEEAVRNLVVQHLEGWGIACFCERNNILALNRHGSAERPTLMLCAHLDTVAPNAGYTRDPFSAGTDADCIWGLGSNDDGGSVVSMIAAFRHFYDTTTLPFNLLLTLSCEEERSGPNGTAHLWTDDAISHALNAAGHPGNWTPQYAIIGEPTGGRAATSERGLLVIDGEAHGVSGHAARNEGVNALYIALDDIQRLRTYDFDRVSPTMGSVKLSVTQMECGTAHNVIPDTCRFVVDIRPTEQYTNVEILEALQAICQSTLTARNLRNRSNATRPGSPLLAALEAVDIETFSSPTTSDWVRTPCDAIKFGPGESSRSHRPDEFILVSEIRQAVNDYVAIIQALQKQCFLRRMAPNPRF